MIKKKICFCKDTDTQIDILNAKQIWVTTRYSYDRYAKRMLPIDKKMIGYADRKVLHDVNPQIASSWREIDKGDSSILIDDVSLSPVDKELNTVQELFSSKEQLLDTIKKYAVKKPEK